VELVGVSSDVTQLIKVQLYSNEQQLDAATTNRSESNGGHVIRLYMKD